MLQAFFNLNRSVCRAIRPYLPQAKENLFAKYEETVVRYMGHRADQIVIDIGGGKSCPFAKHANAETRTTIVALDISAEELRSNADVTLKVVGDLMGRMPMGERNSRPDRFEVRTRASGGC
jgi:hypothetical protein